MAMTTSLQVGGHGSGLGATLRADRWWVEPALVVFGLAAFVAYSTWAAFQGDHYWAAPYLSPFYSPTLFAKEGMPGAVPVEHTWFGAWPSWWPSVVPASPSFLILLFPVAFRFTCYYCRKAYYRSFVGSPPACAVGARLGETYHGETRFLVFQNLHRYALYCILAVVVLHYYHAFSAFFRDGRFGVGVGTLVLLADATLLTAYVFGCHSFRHLAGGRLDGFSTTAISSFSHGLWKRATWLNERHPQFFWVSLFWVGFTDLYVRLVSMDVVRDLNTWGP